MRYFIFSNYINAWTIREGLNRLGIKVEVVSGEGLMPVSKLVPSAGDALFFTEESNLLRFYDSKEFYFHPQNIDRGLIDDKVYFSKNMLAIGEKPVPFWEIGTQHNQAPPQLPIYIKARHSWKGSKKLPRGYICRSTKEREKIFESIHANGWSLNTFFYQKLLNSPLQNNISVSGFFDHQDAKRNMLLLTQKLIGSSDKIATGWIVATTPDPERLLDRTTNILKQLRYTGPFELEFFYEEEDHIYYILEMNFRFWMQHGLFLSFFENGLIKRYLGMDTEKDWNTTSHFGRPLLWIDNIEFILSFLFFRTPVLRTLIQNIREKARICFYPGLFDTLGYLIRRVLRRLRKKFLF